MSVDKPNRRQQCQRLISKLREQMQQMSAPARELFQTYMLNPYLRTGKRCTETYNRWVATDYLRKPVSIREFVLNRYYAGNILADSIYPQFLLDLEELFEGDFIEVVLGGGIGIGKTTFAAIVLAYDVYLVSCLRDPARTYGMVPGTPLTFLNVSVNLKQARSVLYESLFNLVRSSPYFHRDFPYDARVTNELRFRRPGGGPVVVVCRPVAATQQAQLGVAVFSAAIDEINFLACTERSKKARPGSEGLYDQAQEIFNTVSQRLKSRLNQRGKLPGHLIAISSAGYDQDFTERKEKEAHQNQRIFFRRYTPWEVKPRNSFICNDDGSLKTFRVDLGDVARRPRILTDSETVVDNPQVVDVPLDFLPEFTRDMEDSVRNILGHSVLSATPFILNREAIDRMFALGEAAGLQHPFSKVDEHGQPLDVTLQGAAAEVEHLVPDHLHYSSRPDTDQPLPWLLADDCTKMMTDDEFHQFIDGYATTTAAVEPTLYPELRYAHCDLSRSRDATGLVIGHIVGTKKVARLSGQSVSETLPIIRIDLVQRFVPPAGGEIDIPSIRGIFYQLRDECGMEFGLITFDSFASQESIKNLRDNGFKCENFSVDDDFTAYDMLKQAIYDERLLCYSHPKLQQELVRLERTAKKVDHPSSAGASKDLADCLAAVVHHCEVGWAKGSANGLFQIGDVEYR